MAKIIETYYAPYLYGEEPVSHEAIVHDKTVKVMCPYINPDKSVDFSVVTGRIVEFTSFKGYHFILSKDEKKNYHFHELETGMVVEKNFPVCKNYREALKYLLEYSHFRSILDNPEAHNWEKKHAEAKKKCEEWMDAIWGRNMSKEVC